MSNVDALVEVSKIARLVAGGLHYRRFVSNATTAILLTVITGMLAGALLIVGCYAGYVALKWYGFDADAAALIIGGGMAIMTALCGFFTYRLIRKLKKGLSPLASLPHIPNIAQAFMDGFSESSHKA